MNLPSRERLFGWLINVALIAIVAYFGWYVFINKDITLVDKGNGEYAQFCDNRPELCEELVKDYFDRH
jgi:hypothetical protein